MHLLHENRKTKLIIRIHNESFHDNAQMFFVIVKKNHAFWKKLVREQYKRILVNLAHIF